MKTEQNGIALAVMAEALQKHRHLLSEVAGKMESWATESRRGGWSTHQVGPNQEWAEKIRSFLRET